MDWSYPFKGVRLFSWEISNSENLGVRLFFLKNLSKKGVRLFFQKSLQKSAKMVDFPLYNTLKTRFFSRASRAEFLRGALIFLRFSDSENLY